MWNIKKIGCMAMAVIMVMGLQSCQKGDSQVDAIQYPILFDCAENSTRAKFVDVTDMQGDKQGFKVYASFSIKKGSSSSSGSFEKDVRYSESNSNSNWTYSPLEYWWPNATYQFIAFYPNNIASVAPNGGDPHDYSIAIEDIATSQQDILMAQATRTVQSNGVIAAPEQGSVVNLEFNHLLSCIVFKLKSEIENLTVTNVSLTNIAKAGNLTYDDISSDSVNVEWVGTGTTTISLDQDTSLSIQATDFTDVSGGGFLVIPEYVDGSTQKLQIETNQKTYEVNIPEIEWGKGVKYTYTAILKHDNITFNEPSVVDWDEENATGSVIIK